MQWVCSKDVVARSATLGGGSSPVRKWAYSDPRVLAAATVGPDTTRHFPAIEWTINNAMGSEPKLPAWVEISDHIIHTEPAGCWPASTAAPNNAWLPSRCRRTRRRRLSATASLVAIFGVTLDPRRKSADCLTKVLDIA